MLWLCVADPVGLLSFLPIPGNYMRRFFVIFLSAFLLVPAYADPASERLEMGRKLVDLMGYRESAERTGRMCSHPEGTNLDPYKLVESNPNALGGITPKSAYWPRMEAAFKAYRLSLCHVISAVSMLDFLAGNFANRLSKQELHAAITFYSSIEGRSLRHVLIGQIQETMSKLESASSTNSPAYKEYSSELQIIISDFQKSPK
jgi:hypothetical protein